MNKEYFSLWYISYGSILFQPSIVTTGYLEFEIPQHSILCRSLFSKVHFDTILLDLFPFCYSRLFSILLTLVSAAPSPAGFSGQEPCVQILWLSSKPKMTTEPWEDNLMHPFQPKHNLIKPLSPALCPIVDSINRVNWYYWYCDYTAYITFGRCSGK